MKELSLNILDITENSVKAGATLTHIELVETADTLTVTITDDGCGMTEETVRRVTDPFYTTRTTRPVGLGLPLLRMAAEQTGGSVTVESRHRDAHPDNHGTRVTAVFHHRHIDCPPLGDVVSTVITLIQGHPDTDFRFTHTRPTGDPVELDTRQLRQVLEDVPLDSFEVLQWIKGFLDEQYETAAQ
ncbi:MAG: sensor histidine kinase [Clostridia bacterium]|nr:sensor histidine kinase [Clostridia bacterium]